MASSPESTEQTPSTAGMFLTSLAVLGCMLIFAGIVAIAYYYNKPAAANAEDVAIRAARIAEIEQSSADAVVSYEWVDKANGVVRIPVERAMELTVAELNTSEAP